MQDDDGGFGHQQGNSDNSYEEEETLYSVKWYKDNEEFYRYVPKANPPQQSYRVEGIRVDHQSSSDLKVMLKRLALKSSGLYRCEVSAEAPNFSSVEAEGQMEVIYLPRDGPHITGEQQQHEKGDLLNINCTSGKSHPSSTIQWFLNDEPVCDTYVVPYPPLVHSHGLVTTIQGLQMKLDNSHFDNGSMRVKCLTSVSPGIPIHSSVVSDGSAAEARESGLSAYDVNRKTNYAQRKPPLADSREAYILETFSLELTKVVIPAYKFHGESALLECQYELKSNNNNKYNHKRYSNKDSNYRSMQDDDGGFDHQQGNSDNAYEEEETLYSVKWYKDNEEFYRYVPKANPPQR